MRLDGADHLFFLPGVTGLSWETIDNAARAQVRLGAWWRGRRWGFDIRVELRSFRNQLSLPLAEDGCKYSVLLGPEIGRLRTLHSFSLQNLPGRVKFSLGRKSDRNVFEDSPIVFF